MKHSKLIWGLIAVAVTAMGTSGLGVGDAGATVRYVPIPYPTIQAGIDACAPGDTVLVDTGVYTENIHFPEGAIDITVASHYLITGDEGLIDLTVIQPAMMDIPVVTIGPGQTRASVFCGFTVQNGMGLEGHGIACFAASPTIEHNKLTNNCPAFDGGGIFVDAGDPEIRYNHIFGN